MKKNISQQSAHLWETKKELGIGLIQLGNVCFAALIFGQAFGGFQFKIGLAILGLLSLVFFYYLAIIVVMKE